MPGDLFDQINNAVLDLQAADYQGVQRPLRQLSKLLEHPDLEEINRTLTEGVDVDAFLQESEQANNGLQWPEDAREDLALRLLIVRRLGEPDGDFALQFSHSYYAGGSRKFIAGFQGMNRSLIMPFVRDYKSYVFNQGDNHPKLVRPTSRKVFIVHGHDGEARETVARFLSTIGFEPVILHEQANRGRTVIEKVEAHSDVGFAVVLLTPDDVGSAKGAAELEPRARQNVLLELGYFIARLGRARVCALKRGEVLIPSDFAGVVWEDMDAAGGWKSRLGRELEAAGQVIDWNKVMRP
ncbi:MAG: nucleotide-binding protein [Blastomonas fulva]|uniref:nucleotide-binding protein n=1 Tax=Blastomonas fulva TaxID=1550728 RepID=UPI0024E1D90F|nr:nucleotide-binding protein [Blastomonas fulva]MDK2756902.1 nucleotide-binding protein [Blastomonas fulva]